MRYVFNAINSVPHPEERRGAAATRLEGSRLLMQLMRGSLRDFPIAYTDDAVIPGEAYLPETPVLRAHAGTQPDLFLRWNAVPKAAAAIDVVVHLHGFSQQRGDMALAEKVPR